MWGGMTSSAELRAIADVVDKFAIPAVKCTGGQRIDMLGVKKEDLPAVWADLNAAGMVSGAAYAKGLRTVKTCVGSDWCRFGTQDSTGLGIRLEKFMWGSWTPAKLKLAVSGCPRNCAEATCKDIGVICVDSGYDIHFAGAAGLDIHGTQVLCHVDTEDEAVVVIAALTQLYREQGHYLERIYKWLKRVGMESIKAASWTTSRSASTISSASSIRSSSRRSTLGLSARRRASPPTSSSPWPTSPPSGGRRMTPVSDWVAIGRLDDIPRRGARCVNSPLGRIAVFRTMDDRVFATEDRCPHKGGPLSQGIVHGGSVTCPSTIRSSRSTPASSRDPMRGRCAPSRCASSRAARWSF